MPNTARPVATFLAACLREPLEVLRAKNPELGLGLRRQLATIIEGTRRLDGLTRYERLGARMPVYFAASDLSAIVQAGRALGHVADADLRNTLEAVAMLTEALRHDREAEQAQVRDTIAAHALPAPEPVLPHPVSSEPAAPVTPEPSPREREPDSDYPLPAHEPAAQPSDMEPPF